MITSHVSTRYEACCGVPLDMMRNTRAHLERTMGSAVSRSSRIGTALLSKIACAWPFCASTTIVSTAAMRTLSCRCRMRFFRRSMRFCSMRTLVCAWSILMTSDTTFRAASTACACESSCHMRMSSRRASMLLSGTTGSTRAMAASVLRSTPSSLEKVSAAMHGRAGRTSPKSGWKPAGCV